MTTERVKLPKCEIEGCGKDSDISAVKKNGQYAYLCNAHFFEHGECAGGPKEIKVKWAISGKRINPAQRGFPTWHVVKAVHLKELIPVMLELIEKEVDFTVGYYREGDD